MTTQTAAEVKAHHIEKMGEELGIQYNLLWNELAWLYTKWQEYVELFGSKSTRVELLNKAAPAFFRLIQDSLWEDILLNISRLTDPPKSAGRANLTICNLIALATAPAAHETLPKLIENAKVKSQFCRDWRNRRIAHRDLSLTLNSPAPALEPASRERVKDALSAIAAVLNQIDLVYMDSETLFEGSPGRPGGALSLLYAIDDGIRAQIERHERIKRREWREGDFGPRDL